MFDADFINSLLIRLPVLILALTIHEFFHAWTALKFGDSTAKDMGRLTLFPPAHLDLMGSLVMVLSSFQFGWAKPVPVNPFNLRNPRVASFWVSFAGPLSNIGQAIIFSLLIRLLGDSMGDGYFIQMFHAGVWINLILAFFNMIPLFPLDGSHMLKTLAPDSMESALIQFDRIAPFILLILIITDVFWYIVGPFVEISYKILLG